MGRWFSKHLKMLTHEDSSPLPHMQASYHIVKPTESTTSMTCQPQMGVSEKEVCSQITILTGENVLILIHWKWEHSLFSNNSDPVALPLQQGTM